MRGLPLRDLAARFSDIRLRKTELALVGNATAKNIEARHREFRGPMSGIPSAIPADVDSSR
jgi:hypothetical protein